MKPVLVVGDVVVDVLACVDGPIQPRSDTATTIRLFGGGGAANVACWLRHLGVPTTLAARVGDDPAGHEQAAGLAAQGVRLAITIDPEAPTGTVVVLVGPDGERTMLSDRGANLGLRAADLPTPPAGGHLHLSGYVLLHDGPRAAGQAALARARTAGATVSVDPASTAPLTAVGPERFVAWTRGVDLLTPNLAEARLLSGRHDPADAAAALAAEYGAVAVTLGAEGALWARGTELVHVPARPGTARDTTGAGDAFCAGLIAAWLAGLPGSEAVGRAVELAGDAVTRLGARPR